MLGTSSNNTIDQNTALGTSAIGINSFSATGTGNTFTMNDLSNFAGIALGIGFDSLFVQSGNIFTGSFSGLALNNMTGLNLNPETMDIDLTTFRSTALRLDSVTNSTIDGLDLSWAGVAQSGRGIEFNSSSGNTIRNITATNRRTGIKISGTSNSNTIRQSTMSGNVTGISLSGSNHRIESSSILNNSTG